MKIGLTTDPLMPDIYEVIDRQDETKDVFTIKIKSKVKAKKFKSAPGQFNMLYAFGAGEVPISLSGDSESGECIHTVRSVGAITEKLKKLNVGDSLGLRGPFGTSWPIAESKGRDVLIITGGIGLAPLRPLIYYIGRHRKDFANVTLLYGARTPNDLLFVEEWDEWCSEFLIEMNVTVDTDIATSDWKGNVGVVTNLIEEAYFDPSKVSVFTCGPEIMMRYVLLELRKKGVDSSQVFLSMERSMKCAVGWCGHCQYRGDFVCKDGPVYNYNKIKDTFLLREI